MILADAPSTNTLGSIPEITTGACVTGLTVTWKLTRALRPPGSLAVTVTVAVPADSATMPNSPPDATARTTAALELPIA